ncbi:coatomer subunit gamma, putative [Plasmodium knowlesi strain H]|uniref:Coatomer subunit gamma n=3 Tax=Plasmodium knowlesi TaxID=5850 RepID=A0A5E7X1X3_PLAKH|nr:coatomer subunit gamma, putative [Plasmodium knowlesi strain H]OTN65070.1 Coatomer subunit gamma [Plasmodium knowlesi]CAA9988473.1 coatomer subunit gamma, putative [Plasmodium knowlesi strain H]SBO19765.1 coatomer subunit gamma, putative [Plasmodium knowlesi strain H]SBO20474.1 coatomer subunit gamma, putative [Plasmodium knowlesi strain H]VVS77947.1 coatomer subunit gamma, putative [Plasmodium knowlesi strain H]
MLKPIGIKDKIQRNLLKDSKYDDEKTPVNPHEGDKASILQETRVFSSYPLNTQKCMQILTKILYLINKGEEKLTSQECTDIFFNITKLFQSNNERLRRMVYLLIKSLPVNETEVFIVTSSLTKDMNSANDCYRANAIRVLSKIIDNSMATQIERYLKTAIVDKNPFVSCSSLLCGLNLYLNASCDIVKKWIHEVSECINSKNPMIQFHALTLLCSIKYQDKLALEKIISSYNKSSSNLSGSLANCLLIKYASSLIYCTEVDSEIGNTKHLPPGATSPQGSTQVGNAMNGFPSTQASRSTGRTHDMYNIQDYATNKGNFIHPTTKVCFDYLKNCLKSKDPIILFECIKCIFELAIYDQGGRNSTTVFNVDILNECMKVCQAFLLSSKVVEKFSIIRQINKLSHHRPHVASKINQDIENLLTDSNKSICVLAFTTLLKTGNEANIDRLLSQITNYMTGDNTFFKIQIIEELKNLCFIYPSKCNTILSFLSNNLRDEESYQFKSKTIDAIILIISRIPNSEETAILQLCEFIEDCEYNSLLLRVIRFLLVHIPKTSTPSKYIRYIYNRLILENSTIRVDGLYALFHIALKCGSNSKDILFLLNCLLADNDDEVRDRSNFLYYILKEKINKGENLQGEESDSPEHLPLIDELLTNEPPTHLDNLLYLIEKHVEENVTEEFDYHNVKEEIQKMGDNTFKELVTPSSSPNLKRKSSNADVYGGSLNGTKLPEQNTEFVLSEDVSNLLEKYQLGALKMVGKSIPLTESEAEYTVLVKKYIYDKHILLEFIIQNTLSEQVLADVNMQINSFDKKWTVLEKTAIPNLYFNAPQNLYILLGRNIPLQEEPINENYQVNQHFQLSLHFLTKENEMDNGFPDTYSINPLSIQITDFICPRILRNGEFKHIWDNMENLNSEAVSKFSLNFENIQLAVVGLLNTLNMMACDQTDSVEANTTNHNMLLSARYMNESHVLCKASLILSKQYGCLLKIVCRSCERQLSEMLLKSLE